MTARRVPGRLRTLPGDIWALGIVSLLMDASSELVHSLLPVFMTSVLGASAATIGLLEGVAEATASIAKVGSGTLSDRVRKRKALVVTGYGLSALTKPLFPLASSVSLVFTARFLDRIGKGIRGAPRDALVADITPPELRGAAYGLRQALDSVGAVVGPLLALVLMAWLGNNIPAVFWAAVVPAALAVVVLVVAVREPRQETGGLKKPGFLFADIGQLPRRYWLIVAVGSVFTLARFSEAFLVLRAQDVGVALGAVPIVMIIMNVVYAGGAYPAGRAADAVSAGTLLILGLLVLVAADLVLATATAPIAVFVGVACWGLHMALTQGLFSKLVADAATPQLRGTAFGVFNLIAGAALLFASVLAGVLWTSIGPSATFLVGAIFATITMAGVPGVRATNVNDSGSRFPLASLRKTDSRGRSRSF